MSEILNVKAGAVFPGNQNFSGEQAGNITVTGNLTLTGNTVVNGNLSVTGNLLNQGGWALTVHGNCIIEGIFNFTPTLITTPQGNFIVMGDLITGNSTQGSQNCEFKVNPGQSPTMYVNGDWLNGNTGNTNFDGSGNAPGANGLNLLEVGCDIEYITFTMNGADADATHDAGNGGNLVIAGDSQGGQGTMNGGNSTVAGKTPGNGGTIYISGASIAVASVGWSLKGGTANSTAGTGGGTGGSALFGELQGTGGDTCILDLSGGDGWTSGGNAQTNALDLNGIVNAFMIIKINGGNAGNGSGGNAGSCGGDGRWPNPASGDIQAYGGDGTTTGGSGGTFILGSFDGSSLDLHGGNGGSGAGGNGGTITINGIAAPSGSVDTSGGSGSTSGTNGTISVRMFLRPSGFLMLGKDPISTSNLIDAEGILSVANPSSTAFSFISSNPGGANINSGGSQCQIGFADINNDAMFGIAYRPGEGHMRFFYQDYDGDNESQLATVDSNSNWLMTTINLTNKLEINSGAFIKLDSGSLLDIEGRLKLHFRVIDEMTGPNTNDLIIAAMSSGANFPSRGDIIQIPNASTVGAGGIIIVQDQDGKAGDISSSSNSAGVNFGRIIAPTNGTDILVTPIAFNTGSFNSATVIRNGGGTKLFYSDGINTFYELFRDINGYLDYTEAVKTFVFSDNQASPQTIQLWFDTYVTGLVIDYQLVNYTSNINPINSPYPSIVENGTIWITYDGTNTNMVKQSSNLGTPSVTLSTTRVTSGGSNAIALQYTSGAGTGFGGQFSYVVRKWPCFPAPRV